MTIIQGISGNSTTIGALLSIPKFSGKEISLAGTPYTLPSLSTKQARENWEALRELSVKGTPETYADRIGKAAKLVWLALSRNYPELAFEQADELFNVTEIFELLSFVCERSGLRASGPEPVGETSGTAVPLIGPPSTEQSFSAPAGRTITSTPSASAAPSSS